jgi:pimeloyl-ACP methyl ester carboxylesterase
MKFKKDILPAMRAFFPTGGFSIKRYQKDISIARDRVLESSQVVKTAQGLMEYSTFGKGLPVLFIHGAGGGHDMGRAFAKLIGDKFFWICPSRFGYLRTPIPEDASFESQADAYAALLDYLHIEKAAIIGLSVGGPSAVLFALRHPDRCAALVLQSAICKTTAKRPKADWFYNIIFSSDFIYWVVSNTLKNTLVKKFGVDSAVLKSLTQDEKRWVEEALSLFHPASKRYPGILNDQKATISDKQYDLDKINIATLILHALDDCLVDFDFAKYAHAHIPNSELITFPSGGHMLLGQHEKCRQVVAGFLKEHLSKGSGSTL